MDPAELANPDPSSSLVEGVPAEDADEVVITSVSEPPHVNKKASKIAELQLELQKLQNALAHRKASRGHVENICLLNLLYIYICIYLHVLNMYMHVAPVFSLSCHPLRNGRAFINRGVGRPCEACLGPGVKLKHAFPIKTFGNG